VSALEGEQADADGGDEHFEQTIFQHLMSAGIKTGIKEEKAVFFNVERLTSGAVHAKGFYTVNGEERSAYIHIGPKFGTVSKKAVGDAVKECRKKKDADWLVILGFSFENEVVNETITTSLGSFEVTKVRMHDDLMQDGLLKKDRKAGSFITIGEPDVALVKMKTKKGEEPQVQVEIRGLDIYDPIKDEVKARDRHDIAYWMVDDDYDGSNFVVKQVFFCGGEKDEFKKWEKGLSNLAKASTKRNAERTLRIELDEEAFERLYGFVSHPIPATAGRKVAVRIVSQFGEESMKVVGV
jgi:adenine-specific DNA-methyltransferase